MKTDIQTKRQRIYCLKILCVIFFFSASGKALAQTLVTIPVETEKNALVLQTDNKNRLGIIYFGKRLSNANEYAAISTQYNLKDENAAISNNAYTPAGTWNLVEPAIEITHADGNPSLELKYVNHSSQKAGNDVTLTTVTLRDSVYATDVTLYYKAYYKENVYEQWSVITNNEKKPVRLNKYASANLYFIAKDYYLHHYNGVWAREMKPEETLLGAGITTLDSKLGTRANLFQPPSFMLSFDKPATEDEGKILLGTLAWSGNFKLDFEMDNYHNLRLIAGINNYASDYLLAAGQQFQTPSFIYTYTEQGKNDASLNLHHWATKYRLLDGQGSRLTLLNNWESTYFNF